MSDEPCGICGEREHTLACPVGRGLERFAIVNAAGQVVGHHWLSQQMAADVRANAEVEARDTAEFVRALGQML